MTGREPTFEWDSAKDRVKHGVSFANAQSAFFDSRRVIAEDLDHGGEERRYFCFGKVDDSIVSVRFTSWQKRLGDRGASASSAPATGVKASRSMSGRTVKYSAGDIGKVRVVTDFLPPPDALVVREDNVEVTLSLSRRSLDVFKRAAKARRVPYQRMIRALVDAYAEGNERRRK